MRQRTIGDGRVSLTVSEICLGTMYFGYHTDEATSFAILDRFAEAGGTFLDTANNYGQWHGDAGESERVIGRWLRSRGMAGRMVIATKVGARTTVPGDPDARHWQGLGAAPIRTLIIDDNQREQARVVLCQQRRNGAADVLRLIAGRNDRCHPARGAG